MKFPKGLLIAIVIIIGLIFLLESMDGPEPIEETKFIVDSDNKYRFAPEFVGINNWINSEALTMEGLRGKVVLIDFWTYSCYNCINTLPYVTSWWEKYEDSGLVIIGVHTPEFKFEHETANVVAKMEEHGILYPVAQDNSYSTWRAWGNRYWPAKYLIDVNGKVRYQHFGEGNYEQTEKMIQTLLAEMQ